MFMTAFSGYLVFGLILLFNSAIYFLCFTEYLVVIIVIIMVNNLYVFHKLTSSYSFLCFQYPLIYALNSLAVHIQV